MANVSATVLLTPNPGKMNRVKSLLLVVAGQVEKEHNSVLQYQLFEEVGKEGDEAREDRKIIVHINFADSEAIRQYHALNTFQAFWAAISEENLLAVPLDPKICKPFGGFAARS